MNILVTGANGQLGHEIQLVSKGLQDTYFFTDIAGDYLSLDITSQSAVSQFVREHNIQCIINCAAYTNVEKAEEDVNLCRLLNKTAVSHLAKAMKEVDGWLVHVSTDYVFGGDPYNTPCREEQKGTPTGVYGLTKLEGEESILQTGCHHLIFRTAWLYSEYGKNFVKTMLALTEQKPCLNVIFDQTGTPTYAYDLALAIVTILNQRLFEGKEGIYHYSNEGVCSWYDFTQMIATYSSHTACDIRPCHSDEFPSAVKRPAYSVLDKTKFKQTFGLAVPYWTVSLQKCIHNILATE